MDIDYKTQHSGKWNAGPVSYSCATLHPHRPCRDFAAVWFSIDRVQLITFVLLIKFTTELAVTNT